MSNTKSSNQTAVPEAKGALDRFKFEVANELGVPLTDGYNGNLTSKQNGSVGGYMVKKIVSEQPLNFNSIFYIIPRVIVNYRTTFPGISLLIFLFHPLLKASLVAQNLVYTPDMFSGVINKVYVWSKAQIKTII